MDNKLTYYNNGTIDTNETIFLKGLRDEYGIKLECKQRVLCGYTFRFKNSQNIRVKFFDNGTQLVTEFYGDNAQDVIELYRMFDSQFTE